MPWTYTSCAACCINMGCGNPKVPPTELTAVADLTGSCPQAANNVLTVTVPGSFPTCEELCTGNPCYCVYSWIIADADRVACQPFIDHVYLDCRDAPGAYPLAEGCDHVRYQKRIWYAEIGVTAATVLPGPTPILSFIDAGTGHVWCNEQQADCTFVYVDRGAGPCPDSRCRYDCPPCRNCPEHRQRRCDLGLECCGTGGCPPAPRCPDEAFLPCSGPCYPCSHQWVETPTTIDQSCAGCTLSYSSRTYMFWGYACSGSVTIEGCNPTACPPDPLNYSDFYLNFNCTDDSLTFSCPATGEMLVLRRKLPPNQGLIAEMVRRMPAGQVAELLRKLEG
jgi:hypothetical protein